MAHESAIGQGAEVVYILTYINIIHRFASFVCTIYIDQLKHDSFKLYPLFWLILDIFYRLMKTDATAYKLRIRTKDTFDCNNESI